jgi:hypothetical protein
MRATPLLANIIVGVIAAGVFVARLVATQMYVPATEPVAPVTASESGHGHKADRLTLFQPPGPSVATAVPVRLRGAAGSDNTTVVAKNVIIHPIDAARSFDNTGLVRDARPVSVVVIKPAGGQAGDWNHEGQQRRFPDRRVAAKRDWREDTTRAAPKNSQ